MKKNIVIALAALMMLAVSCKKNIVETTNNGNNNPTVAIEQSPDVTRIINFNKEVTARRENPDLRTREVITLEEAKNDIADLFNAVYTEPTEYYGETEHAEFIVTLPVDDNGNVLLDDAVAAYEEAVEMARENYHASALGNKGYICMSATVEQQRGGTAEVRLNGVFGNKTEAPTAAEGDPFDESSDWLYKYESPAECDEYMDEGGDKALERVMCDNLIPKITTPNGYRVITYGNITKPFYGSWYMEKLFYRENVNATCISGEEMNYYLANGEEIATITIPDSLGIALHRDGGQQITIPRLYAITSLTVYGTEGVSHEPPYNPYIMHGYSVTYGFYDLVMIAQLEPEQL